jgi:hypothetical protein
LDRFIIAVQLIECITAVIPDHRIGRIDLQEPCHIPELLLQTDLYCGADPPTLPVCRILHTPCSEENCAEERNHNYFFPQLKDPVEIWHSPDGN